MLLLLYYFYFYYFALSTEWTWFDYISLLIIPCIIYYVTNKETLNLERRRAFFTLTEIMNINDILMNLVLQPIWPPHCPVLKCLLCVQEGDDYEVIPNSSFFVSRTAAKDNSSSYHINGKKATFKDVGALLRSHGIDLDHNRFLILQVITPPACCWPLVFSGESWTG